MATGEVFFGSGQNGVRIEGLSKLTRSLRKAGVDAGDLKDTMHSIGEIVMDAARPEIAVVSGRMVGTLRAGRGQTKAVVRMGSKRVPYAGRWYYTESTRPLDAARDANRERIVRTLNDGIGDVLRKNDLI